VSRQKKTFRPRIAVIWWHGLPSTVTASNDRLAFWPPAKRLIHWFVSACLSVIRYFSKALT